MRYYDIIIITNQESFLTNKKIVSIINEIIIYNNFIILKIEYCGFINFMYKIKNHSKGYYIMMSFTANNFIINKVLKFLRSDLSILRFLILKFTKKNHYISSFTLNNIFKEKFKN